MIRKFGQSTAGKLSFAGIAFMLASVAMAQDIPPAPDDAPAATKPGEKPGTDGTAKGALPKPRDPYAVPNGTPEEILAFIDKLQEYRPRVRTREEAITHVIKVQNAIAEAGARILADARIDDDLAEQAAEIRLESLAMLAQAELPGAADEAIKAAQELSKDKRPVVATLGEAKLFELKVMLVNSLPAEERKAIIAETLAEVQVAKPPRASLQRALVLADSLESGDDAAEAAAVYEELAKVFGAMKTPDAKAQAAKLAGTARRMRLPGNAMELEGVLVDGKPFSWDAYRGKVVLVDFWATWCGPCRAELPNVKKLYQQYHARGFDVVGISLDNDESALNDFLKEEEIPWATLFDASKPDLMGWNHPLVSKYGIGGIPTAILVGADGKVVSLSARGEELGELLEKLLGKTAAVEPAPASAPK